MVVQSGIFSNISIPSDRLLISVFGEIIHGFVIRTALHRKTDSGGEG